MSDGWVSCPAVDIRVNNPTVVLERISAVTRMICSTELHEWRTSHSLTMTCQHWSFTLKIIPHGVRLVVHAVNPAQMHVIMEQVKTLVFHPSGHNIVQE